MKRAALVLTSFALVALAAAACGGANDSELFDPTGSSQAPTDPATSGTGVGTAPSGSSSNGSSGASTSSSSSGGSSSSSSGSSTSSSSSSSSSSGGSTSSSGSSGTTWKSPGIYCGQDPNNGTDVYCQPQTSVCCLDHFNGDFSQECKPAGPTACPQQSITLRCNDETDCAGGQVCCATFDQQSGYRSSQCATQCPAGTGGTISVRLCDPDAPVDQCLSIGKSCQPSSSLSGYSICK